MAALLRTRPKPSPFEEAARKDSAVHVSLSSDSPVKQPGSAPTPLSGNRRAAEAIAPDYGRRQVTVISEELRRRAIAPSGGAPCGGYIGPMVAHCQPCGTRFLSALRATMLRRIEAGIGARRDDLRVERPLAPMHGMR